MALLNKVGFCGVLRKKKYQKTLKSYGVKERQKGYVKTYPFNIELIISQKK